MDIYNSNTATPEPVQPSQTIQVPQSIPAEPPENHSTPIVGLPNAQNNSNKKLVIIIGLIILLIIILMTVILISSRQRSIEQMPQATRKPTMSQISTSKISPTVKIENIEPIQPSLLQNYFYSDDGINAIYFSRKSETQEECSYFFVSNKRKYLGASDYPSVLCTTGEMSGVVDLVGYKKWVDNIYLVSEMSSSSSGKIVIFDVHRNFLPYEYAYFRDKYTFKSVDDSLKYWIFSVNVPEEKDKTQFEVLDKTKKQLAQISIDTPPEWDLFETLYDTVNKGYVFIIRKFTENQSGDSYAETRIDFYSMENFLLKNVYSGQPILTPGRGCSPSSVISKQKGQILLKADCFLVPQDYLDIDGNMKFSIQ